jgi:hypothetical protein
MSSLKNEVEKVIEKYINTVAKQYNLDQNELLKLWSGETGLKPSNVNTSLCKDTNDLSPERLMKCSKAELNALCKTHNYKCTGTKEVLINRLLGKEEETKKTEKKETKKETKKEKTKKVETTDVVKKLTSNISVIPIRRNKYGNLEHPETGLVFDKKTENVTGKQLDNGTISDLTDDDIEMCKKFKFKYNIPSNLDKNNNSDEDEEVVEEEEEDIVDEIEDDGEEVEEDEEEVEEDEEEVEEDEEEEDFE